MKLILRFIALKMSILRVDAAIIKRKKVKRNLYPCRWNPATTYRIPGVGYPGSFAVSFDLHEAYEINEK